MKLDEALSPGSIVMENLHVVMFFFMNLGFVYYSVYVLAILLSFRVV